MKFLHFLNAVAWLMNSILWAFYARVALFAVASVIACAIAAYLALKPSTYDDRLARARRLS